MNQFLIFKGVKIKTAYIVLVVFLLAGGATAAILNQETTKTHQQDTGNPLIDAAKSGQGTSYHEKRISDAQDVENIVNNVLNGDVEALDGLDALQKIRILANQDIDLSPEEMKVNKNYIAFVASAEDVLKAKLYKTGQENAKLDIMKEKKGQI